MIKMTKPQAMTTKTHFRKFKYKAKALEKYRNIRQRLLFCE